MASLKDFRPSTHGLHFDNRWPPGTPDFVFTIPILGRVRIGDASDGLCGGMAFTAADLYLAGRRPPATTDAPAGGTALFDYIAARLLASFSIPTGVLKYYRWANTPDLTRKTIKGEIPRIIADIDHGRPATLGLVTVRSFNPAALGRCHQVLAYAYDRTASSTTFRVYDPNQHDDDNVTISVNAAGPIASTVRCDPIRGFFHVDYSRTDPAAIAG